MALYTALRDHFGRQRLGKLDVPESAPLLARFNPDVVSGRHGNVRRAQLSGNEALCVQSAHY